MSALTMCTVHWNVTVQASEFGLVPPHTVSCTLGLFFEHRFSVKEAGHRGDWLGGARQKATRGLLRSWFLAALRFEKFIKVHSVRIKLDFWGPDCFG